MAVFSSFEFFLLSVVNSCSGLKSNYSRQPGLPMILWVKWPNLNHLKFIWLTCHWSFFLLKEITSRDTVILMLPGPNYKSPNQYIEKMSKNLESYSLCSKLTILIELDYRGEGEFLLSYTAN